MSDTSCRIRVGACVFKGMLTWWPTVWEGCVSRTSTTIAVEFEGTLLSQPGIMATTIGCSWPGIRVHVWHKFLILIWSINLDTHKCLESLKGNKLVTPGTLQREVWNLRITPRSVTWLGPTAIPKDTKSKLPDLWVMTTVSLSTNASWLNLLSALTSTCVEYPEVNKYRP